MNAPVNPKKLIRGALGDWEVVVGMEIHAQVTSRAKLFSGTFHVLGGRLSALDGVRPEDLAIPGLLARVEAGGVDEVVLAMNATLEGQTTAHYLAERLEDFPVRITQLAHGLPVGGELDYLDEGTLAQALRARRPLG